MNISDFTRHLGSGHSVMDGDLRLTETTKGGTTSGTVDKVNYGGFFRRIFFKNARTVTSPAENRHVRVALFKAVASAMGENRGVNPVDSDLKDLRDALGIAVKEEGGRTVLDEENTSAVALSRLTAQHVIERFTGVQQSAEIRDAAGYDRLENEFGVLKGKHSGNGQTLRFELYKSIANYHKKPLDSADLKGLRSALGIALKTVDNTLVMDDKKTSKADLTDDAAKKIIEKYSKGGEAAKTGSDDWKEQWTVVTDKEKGKSEIKSSYFRIVDSKNKDAVTWRRFGGEKGLGLSKTQFDSLFDRALDVAVKTHAKEASGLKNLVAHLKSVFADKNASVEDLQVFFGDDREYRGGHAGVKSRLDLDAASVAEKLVWMLEKNKVLPEVSGKVRKDLKVGILPDDFKAQLEDYQKRMSTYGDVDDVIMLPLAKKEQSQERQVRDMIGDLFFNEEDPMEMEKYGFSDGERLGRVLFRHGEVFRKICLEVAQKDLALKKRQENPLEGDKSCFMIAQAALRQINADLASQFEDLIRGINKHLTFGKGNAAGMLELTASECLNKAQAIFKEIAGAEFERKIDAALTTFFTQVDDGDKKSKDPVENTWVYNRICDQLKLNENTYCSDDTKLLQNVLKSNLVVPSGQDSGSGNVALRRMLSAGTRYSTTGLGAGKQFDVGAMLRGGGPALIKRLQSLSSDLYTDESIPANMRTALTDVANNLPGSGDLVLKMQLFGTVKQLQEADPGIKGIKVTNACLGAASIAQAIECTLVYDDEKKNKDVVIKLVRPDVSKTFQKEVEGFGKVEGGDVSTKTITLHFIDDVKPEFDLSKETLNAFVASVLNRKDGELDQEFRNGKANKAKSLDTASFKIKDDLYRNLGKMLGQTKGMNRMFGTENLIWRNTPDGKPTAALLEQAQRDLELCQKAFDNEKEEDVQFEGQTVKSKRSPKDYYAQLSKIVQKYCVVSPGCIVMEKAKGVAMEKFLLGVEKDIDDMEKDVNRQSNSDEKTKILTKLEKAKRSMMQLGQELFNGLVHGQPPSFHGDLHGGNIMYNEADGTYTLIDYGKGTPLTKDEAQSIVDCFTTVSKPFTNDPNKEEERKGFENEVQERAETVISLYRKALQAEYDVLKDAGNAESEIGNLILTTIERLDPDYEGSYENEGMTDYEALMSGLLKVLAGTEEKVKKEHGNTDAGNIVEEFSQLVKAQGLAMSNTLFGFFDSYGKLAKSLGKLDTLITKVDPSKTVTVFDEDFSFGETQTKCEDVVDKLSKPGAEASEEDLETMGSFYEKLPRFIREESDQSTYKEVLGRAPKYTEMTGEEKKKYDNAQELDVSNLTQGGGLTTGIGSFENNMDSKPAYDFLKTFVNSELEFDIQATGKGAEVKDWGKNVDKLLSAVQNVKAGNLDKTEDQGGEADTVDPIMELIIRDFEGQLAKGRHSEFDNVLGRLASFAGKDIPSDISEVIGKKFTGGKGSPFYKEDRGAHTGEHVHVLDFENKELKEFAKKLKDFLFGDPVFKDKNVWSQMKLLAGSYEYSYLHGGDDPSWGVILAMRTMVVDESARQKFKAGKKAAKDEYETYINGNKDKGVKGHGKENYQTADKLEAGAGKDLQDLTDRCKNALKVISRLKKDINSDFSTLGGILYSTINGGK